MLLKVTTDTSPLQWPVDNMQLPSLLLESLLGGVAVVCPGSCPLSLALCLYFEAFFLPPLLFILCIIYLQDFVTVLEMVSPFGPKSSFKLHFCTGISCCFPK